MQNMREAIEKGGCIVICHGCAAQLVADNELIDSFCLRRASQSLKETTIFEYRLVLSSFAVSCFAEGISIFEAQTADLDRFLKTGGFTDRNAARQLSVLRVFYRWVVKMKMVPFSPATFLRVPKTWSNTPRSRPECEIMQILANARKAAIEPNASPCAIRDWAIKAFFYASAVRREECANVDLSKVNLKDGTLWVKGKRGKERISQIDAFGVEAVEFYLKHARPRLAARATEKAPSKALFLTMNGTRLSLSNINRIASEMSPHEYRHSWATHKANAGVDLKKISNNLGHDELQTTTIYFGDVPFEELRKAHRQFHPSERSARH